MPPRVIWFNAVLYRWQSPMIYLSIRLQTGRLIIIEERRLCSGVVVGEAEAWLVKKYVNSALALEPTTNQFILVVFAR